uniref:Ribosomal subunit interface protein n=1 Tax=Rhodosorus marinus TaxID=101924 RepID=A0A7S2ZXA4_9RHOD|mmetsp:Transcript_36337/g.145275  ORF Transcript_36337/g.145275 Transcript_36337/m.145275 type:complete len:100 (+) Transcript_36337:424-723(+)
MKFILVSEDILECDEHGIRKVDVHLSVAHNPSIKHAQAAEVVVFAVGTVMRAEVKMENAYSSIDLVADKISRKLRKYKERKERSKDRSKEKTSEVGSIS